MHILASIFTHFRSHENVYQMNKTKKKIGETNKNLLNIHTHKNVEAVNRNCLNWVMNE